MKFSRKSNTFVHISIGRNMEKTASVEHSGVVEYVDSQVVRVGFVSHASCSSCHAKGACSISEVDSKYVEVKTSEKEYKIGEPVTIVLEQKMGFKALWFGYIIPLIVLLIGVIVTYSITGKDGLAGLVAIGLLPPYYLLLYFYRDTLKNKFEFTLKKSNTL